MAYQKRYRTIVPVPRKALVSDAVVVWLTRESFDRAAAAEALVLVEFTDAGQLDPADIPPKAEKQLDAPATDFTWRLFEGLAERAPDA